MVCHGPVPPTEPIRETRSLAKENHDLTTRLLGKNMSHFRTETHRNGTVNSARHSGSTELAEVRNQSGPTFKLAWLQMHFRVLSAALMASLG